MIASPHSGSIIEVAIDPQRFRRVEQKAFAHSIRYRLILLHPHQRILCVRAIIGRAGYTTAAVVASDPSAAGVLLQPPAGTAVACPGDLGHPQSLRFNRNLRARVLPVPGSLAKGGVPAWPAWLATCLPPRSGPGVAEVGVFARLGLVLRPEHFACGEAEGVFACLAPAPAMAISDALGRVPAQLRAPTPGR